MRSICVAAGAAAIAALSLASLAPARPAVTELKAFVGREPRTFGLETFSGEEVKTLRAGRYRLHVFDRNNEMNFHLRGPGVNRSTSAHFAGKQLWLVTLRRGVYVYSCDTCWWERLRKTFRVR